MSVFTFKALVKRSIPWLRNDRIILSSGIRLARNLDGIPFPNRANRKVQLQVFDKLVESIPGTYEFSNCHIVRLNEIHKTDRLLLMERHLISHGITVKNSGMPGVIFSEDEKVSMMANEEDHLRLQALFAGRVSLEQWKSLSKIERRLDEKLHFAFQNKYGFLTSRIADAGTGLRVSSLVHLPGIVLTNQLNKLIGNLVKLNFNISGFYGEGTKPVGDIYQVSSSLGFNKPEEDIINGFDKFVATIAEHEQEARSRIRRYSTNFRLEDQIHRAFGILSHAKAIDSEESVLHLCKLKLAPEFGISLPLHKEEINRLIFEVQPAHLQEILNKELSSQQRDIERAELIRKNLFY